MDFDLGVCDEDCGRVEPATNPFSTPKVQTMCLVSDANHLTVINQVVLTHFIANTSGLQKANRIDVSQTVLALRGSDGFSRDLWRVAGVCPRSLGARSWCKNRYLVTLTFAPLEPKGWSRAHIHKNSMVFVNFCPRPRYGRQATSDAADVCC